MSEELWASYTKEHRDTDTEKGRPGGTSGEAAHLQAETTLSSDLILQLPGWRISNTPHPHQLWTPLLLSLEREETGSLELKLPGRKVEASGLC